MLKWKALATGIITIVALGLTTQLVFLLLAVGYHEIINDNPSLESLLKILSAAGMLLSYFIIMSLGGFITAHMAQQRVMLHGLLVATFSCGLSLIPFFSENGINLNGMLFLLFGIGFTLVGCWIWDRKHSADVSQPST